MAAFEPTVVSTREASLLATHKVLRNTYLLLSMTLLFSAAMAALSVAFRLPSPGLILFLVGAFGFPWLVNRLRNSGWGVVAVFGMTGFFGLVLGPLLSYYIYVLPNGGELIALALGGTAAVFLAMSFIALTSKRDFSGLIGTLSIGALVGFGASVVGYAFGLPTVSLVAAGLFVPVASGLMLWQTQQIVRGGEDNYLLATVTLYVSIYNLFVSLLQLLGVFGGDD
jgi:modulator of FtsH protease